jgi:hypothetical protein
MNRLHALILTISVALPLSAAAEGPAPVYVDLQTRANQEFTANLGSGREGNNLSEVPRGEQTFEGVKFKVGDRFLQLGSPLLAEPKPERVEGIPVGRAFTRLHVLHGTLYGNGMVIGQEGQEGDPLYVADGTRIGQYTVRYEDGTTEVIPIVYGEDVRDWWFTGEPKAVTRGKVAWKGENTFAKQFDTRLRLFLGTWQNPKPDKKAVGIDFEKADGTPASPICIAVSLEEK